MSVILSIIPSIIEDLYCEAILLSREVRRTFVLPSANAMPTQVNVHTKALSSEALQATTRMLHATAWILNRRAFLRGELTGPQLRSCGRLPQDSSSQASTEVELVPEVRRVVQATEQFYARVARLELAWSQPAFGLPSTVSWLQEQAQNVAR